jgi:hypothetical protein
MNRRVEITLLIREEKLPIAPKITENKKIATKISDKSFINTVEIQNVVSHELKKIAAQNIEYITPAEMKQGESGLVEAIVSESMLKNLLKRLDNTTYKRISAISDVDINGLVLSGNSFLIKKLQGEKFGKWVWEVTPNENGISSITLITNIRISSNDGIQTFNIPLFLKAVDVKSKPTYYFSNFMSKGLYIIFLIVLALGIFTMISKKNKVKNIKRSNYKL